MQIAIFNLESPLSMYLIAILGVVLLLRAILLTTGWVQPGWSAYSARGHHVMGVSSLGMGLIGIFYLSNLYAVCIGAFLSLVFIYGVRIEALTRKSYEKNPINE